MAAIPTHQVLFTTELLEEILLRTPPKDVLLLQRLCKGWKDVIEGSVKLQRMLFFLPIGPVENDPESGRVLGSGDIIRNADVTPQNSSSI